MLSRTLRSQRNIKHGLWVNNIRRRWLTTDPTSVISTLTDSFQALHAYSGLPWWALIPLTTVTLRSLWTLPLAVFQRNNLRKQRELRPVINASYPVLKYKLANKAQNAKQKAAESLKNFNSDSPSNQNLVGISTLQSPLASMKYEEILLLSAKEMRKRQKSLFRQNKVQLWKNFLLPAFQVPLWISMSFTMKNLTGWESWFSSMNRPLESSLYNEGFLWMTDLTISDSMHIMPILVGIFSLMNVEWTFKTFELLNPAAKNKQAPSFTRSMANISRMSVVFLMVASFNAPVALVLYWVSSQLYSLVQNIIFDTFIPIAFTPKKRFNYGRVKLNNGTPIIAER